MNKVTLVTLLFTAMIMFLIPHGVQADDEGTVFRRSNFSNEFKINTPEGINARGTAVVKSKNSKHRVKINVNGLPPGETYVILNHWFEPVPERGVPNSDDGPEDDPSCNGHFQFIGEPVVADKKGRLKINVTVDQLAPHIWVANFAKFLEVTNNGTQAPANADAFTLGGLVIPYMDIVEQEEDFVDTDPLTDCNI
jgi:hypothetical protein